MAIDEREIFLNALDQPDDQARRLYLDDACHGDTQLRSKVEQLLAASTNTADFLETAPPGLDLTIQSDAETLQESSFRDVSLDFLTHSSKPGCLGTLGVYEVVGIVGRGAFGIVLRAYDTKLNRIVAIKVMSPELATNPMAVKRFLREAQAAAAVQHDHVVTIHAIDETNVPPFIVMEYVQGQSLKEKVESHGTPEVIEILRIGKQMAAGLAAAHEQGLVHRDIKPANILLENGIQRVKITDFGLARAVDDVGMTQTGIIAGTPQYMSPEQGLGKPIDERSDLFSLGSVLYTLCTGRAPFRADSAVATLRRVCDDEPRPIREVNPEVPDWLERIVLQLLSKSADDRIQSAEEVEKLFASCLSHVQSARASSIPAVVKASRNAATTESSVGNLSSTGQKGTSRRTVQLLWLSVAHLVALLISIVVCMIELRSIMVLGPLLSILSIPIGILAYRTRLGWLGIGYGLYWPLLLVAFARALAWVPQRQTVDLILRYVTGVGVAWGFLLVGKQLFDLVRQPSFRLSEIRPNKTWAWKLTYVLCFVLAVAAANSMLEPESAIPWAAIVLSIGLFQLLIGLTIARESLAFALSSIVVSASVLCCGTLFPLDDFLFEAKANWTVRGSLVAVFSIVLFGLRNLHSELVRCKKAKRLSLRFDVKGVFVGVAAFAASMAAARPFLQFSGQAFVAGFLMFLTVLSLAYLTILAIGGWEQRRQLSIALLGFVAMTLAGASWLAHSYDIATRSTHLWVDTKEQVELRLVHDDPRLPTQLSVNPGDAGWSFDSGAFEIEVVGRDDLKAVPSKLNPLPRVWTRVKIVSNESKQ